MQDGRCVRSSHSGSVLDSSSPKQGIRNPRVGSLLAMWTPGPHSQSGVNWVHLDITPQGISTAFSPQSRNGRSKASVTLEQGHLGTDSTTQSPKQVPFPKRERGGDEGAALVLVLPKVLQKHN